MLSGLTQFRPVYVYGFVEKNERPQEMRKHLNETMNMIFNIVYKHSSFERERERERCERTDYKFIRIFCDTFITACMHRFMIRAWHGVVHVSVQC